jgi:predicted small lipoprotein YifL
MIFRRLGMKNILVVGILSALLLITACGPKRPVVYPDAKVQEVGEEQVRADVADCLRQAKEAGVGTSKAGTVAKSTAVGAGAGAAIGAAVGAFGRGAGTGAAQGAAGGGVAGLIGGLLRAYDLDPVEKQFVEECLRRKGYSTIGWR